MTEYVSGSDLDTLHALTDLKHPDQLPRQARRPKAPQSRKMSVAEALKVFAKGLPVARVEETQPGQTPIYIRGEVRSYKHPYWRIAYYNQEWEEITRTEVLHAARLYTVEHVV